MAAGTMWKFDGSNLEEVTRAMKEWRGSSSQHLPNIESPAPTPGPNVPTPIGPTPRFPVPAKPTYPHQAQVGDPAVPVVGKALPCDDIPAAFKYQAIAQDTSPVGYTSSTGKTYLEDALVSQQCEGLGHRRFLFLSARARGLVLLPSSA